MQMPIELTDYVSDRPLPVDARRVYLRQQAERHAETMFSSRKPFDQHLTDVLGDAGDYVGRRARAGINNGMMAVNSFVDSPSEAAGRAGYGILDFATGSFNSFIEDTNIADLSYVVPIAVALSAMVAHMFVGTVPDDTPELVEELKADPSPSVVDRAMSYIKSFWDSSEEAKEVIKNASPTIVGYLNDLGFGGTANPSTALGEPYWDAGERRQQPFTLQATELKRKRATHNFTPSKLTRTAAQPFSGHHTLERL